MPKSKTTKLDWRPTKNTKWFVLFAVVSLIFAAAMAWRAYG